jgi:hypothetical protein
MKPLPLIGALVFSATPVQAFETVDEVREACEATKENLELCKAMSSIVGAIMSVTAFCELEKSGIIEAEKLTEFWEYNYTIKKDTKLEVLSAALWREGVNFQLKDYPDCSIKPVP